MSHLDLDGVEDPIKDHFELIEGAIGDEHFQRYLQYKEETHGEPPIMRSIAPITFNDQVSNESFGGIPTILSKTRDHRTSIKL